MRSREIFSSEFAKRRRVPLLSLTFQVELYNARWDPNLGNRTLSILARALTHALNQQDQTSLHRRGERANYGS